MSETVSVTYTVRDYEQVRGAGRLTGLAIVDVDVEGITMTLQGVQVMQADDGSMTCRAPVWRHPKSGQWLPGVVLPPTLTRAIADAVMECASPL